MTAHKTCSIPDQVGRLGSYESLVNYDFQNLLTILAQFLQKYIKNSYNFNSIEITWRKNGMFSLFETSVNGKMTFAYIVTFH